MKVIYNNIFQDLDKLISEAREQQRNIHYIELSRIEYKTFIEEAIKAGLGGTCYYNGVAIKERLK
jgi:hypothetical protein